MKASAMLINNEKANILFFNTPRVAQYFLTLLLGFGIGEIPMKYMSLPLVYNSLNSYW